MDNLLKPDNKAELTKILTCHVVAGNITSGDLLKLIKQDGGKASVKTVEGNVARITIANVKQSNGEIHVIDKVLMP